MTRSRLGRGRLLAVSVLIAGGVVAPLDPAPAVAATIPARPALCYPPDLPTMTSFSASPSTIDVDSDSAQVTFTIDAKDTVADINEVDVYYGGPKGDGGGLGTAYGPTSGTARDGTWTMTITVPRWSARGHWIVGEVDIYDARYGEDTTQFQSNYYANSTSWKSSWASGFTVRSADVQPPTVTSVSLSPGTVNTSHAQKNIKVTVKATDDLSGIDSLSVSGSATIGGHRRVTTGGVLARSSGTRLHGTYKGVLTVPPWAGSTQHIWSLTLTARDRSGNLVTLDAAQLKAKHLSSSFKVTSRRDVTKPKLTSLTWMINTAFIGWGDKATVGVSDAASGIAGVRVTLTSPSGSKVVTDLELETGTVNSGLWGQNASVWACEGEPGVWTVSLRVVDVAGNTLTVSSAQLKARHLPSTVHVTVYDLVPPTAAVPTTAPHAGPVVVTFNEPTLWKGAAIPLTVYRSGTQDVVSGTWHCRHVGVAVGCNANHADVTTAIFEPSSPFTLGNTYTVKSVAGIYDTSGNGPAQIKARFKAT